MKSFLTSIIYLLLLFQFIGHAKEKNPMIALWKDSTFQKEFTASYGTLSGYEPDISELEKARLRELIKIIRQKPLDAIKELASQINSNDSAAFDFILANLYFQEGQLEEAEQYYQSAVKKYPSFRRAYKNLGLVQIQSNDFVSAIESLSKSMELGLVDGRAYGLLGYSYLTEGDYLPAEAAYRQAILMQPDVLDWKLGLARCLLEMEDFKGAVSIFNTLILEDPTNADYWVLQSNAFIAMDQSMRAASNLEVVERLGKARFDSLSLLGDIYMNHSMPELALNAYLKASEMALASDIDTLIKSANALTQTANFKEALTIINQIRDRFNDSIDEHQDLKLLTYEAKIARYNGEADKAASILVKIIERDLLNGEALIELANYYADQGQLPEAYTRFEQAQKINAYERPALIAQAQVLVKNQQYKKALRLLNRALMIESDPLIQDYKDRVERAAQKQY